VAVIARVEKALKAMGQSVESWFASLAGAGGVDVSRGYEAIARDTFEAALVVGEE